VPGPLPAESEVILRPPDLAEVELLARGFVTAVAPPGGLTHLQEVLLRAICESMTGFRVDPLAAQPIGPGEFAQRLRSRNLEFRTRIVQVMLLGELVLMPLPEEVADRVLEYAEELGVDDGMISVARSYAAGSMGLALVDFNRNGYTAEWDPQRATMLHASVTLEDAWEPDCHDPELADRWASLEHCPPGSLGRGVFEFYRARGFSFPGLPGSASPYLAQHDWVHVIAEFGTTVEAELEVFGLIGRAIPDPRGFSLLAMVVGLFETGYLPSAAGLFQADTGHLSKGGMADRLADAMRRGALCGKDLMGVDFFRYAGVPVDSVREDLGIVAKSERAMAAGSVGPWERGGISPFQVKSGQGAAAADGRSYESYGAQV
jgi:hypothetical protein